MEKAYKQRGLVNWPLLLGTFILGLFFFALLDTTILFVFGISISRWNLFLAVLCSGTVCFFLSDRSIKATILVVLLGITILGVAVLLSVRVYDWSWDGNRYHKSIAGALKLGWNPLQKTFYEFAEDYPFLAEIRETWYDAYPKGTEIWAACLYIITNSIETGKSFNLLALVSAFCIGCGILTQVKMFHKPQILFFALLCVANPIALSQLTTYYVDGFLWQTILICMAALLYLTFFEKEKYEKVCFYLVFISIGIGFNVKFSALIYFALLCGSVFCYWVFCKIKDVGLRKAAAHLMPKFCFFVGAVVNGTVLSGASSYVVNVIRHRNPFYTMIGKDSVEMITSQLPFYYKDMSNMTRFVTSLFSKTSNNKKLTSVQLKIPFTFSASEITPAQNCDVRVAGWGILFSGIFLVGLFVLLVGLIRLSGKRHKAAKSVVALTVLLLCVFFFSIFFVPGLSWARYNVAVFYIPLGALLYLFGYLNRTKGSTVLPAFIAGILSVTCVLNIVPNLERIWLDYKEYDEVRQQLTELKRVTDGVESKAIIGYSQPYRFEGRFFSLYDAGITNFEYGHIEASDRTSVLFNHERTLWCRDPRPWEIDGIIDQLHNTQGKLIMFAVKDEGSKALTQEFISGMRDLGLAFDLEDSFRASYIAAIMNGAILVEKAAEEQLSYHLQTDGISVSLVSAGYSSGNTVSIKISGEEYAIGKRGINIVIYDMEKGQVEDSLCIDTYLDNKISR